MGPRRSRRSPPSTVRGGLGSTSTRRSATSPAQLLEEPAAARGDLPSGLVELERAGGPGPPTSGNNPGVRGVGDDRRGRGVTAARASVFAGPESARFKPRSRCGFESRRPLAAGALALPPGGRGRLAMSGRRGGRGTSWSTSTSSRRSCSRSQGGPTARPAAARGGSRRRRCAWSTRRSSRPPRRSRPARCRAVVRAGPPQVVRRAGFGRLRAVGGLGVLRRPLTAPRATSTSPISCSRSRLLAARGTYRRRLRARAAAAGRPPAIAPRPAGPPLGLLAVGAAAGRPARRRSPGCRRARGARGLLGSGPSSTAGRRRARW